MSDVLVTSPLIRVASFPSASTASQPYMLAAEKLTGSLSSPDAMMSARNAFTSGSLLDVDASGVPLANRPRVVDRQRRAGVLQAERSPPRRGLVLQRVRLRRDEVRLRGLGDREGQLRGVVAGQRGDVADRGDAGRSRDLVRAGG